MLIINWCLLLYFYIFILANSIKENYLVFDTIISTLLFMMSLLKIERYFDTYYLKIISYFMLIILWFKIYFNYNSVMILIYYLTIFIYEIIDCFYKLYNSDKIKNVYILKTIKYFNKLFIINKKRKIN